MLKHLLALVIIASVFVQSAEAQYNMRRNIPPILRGFSVSAKVGPNMFFGDLVDDGRLKIGIDFMADKEVLRWMSVRADLGGGMLGGNQESGQLTFKTTYLNFSVGANVTFLNLIQGYYSGRIIDPYVGLGGGMLMFSAKKESITAMTEEEIAADDWRNVETGFTAAPFVYGLIGGRYNINSHWSIIAEIQGNLPFSDDLDGHTGWRSGRDENGNLISESQPDADGSMPLGEWNDGKNDFFYTFMAGVSYKFHDMRWKVSSKYNRKTYLRNRKAYKRNANRTRYR